MTQALRNYAKLGGHLQGLQVGSQVLLEAGALLLAEPGLALDGAVEACQALLADVGCLRSAQGFVAQP